ncbi:hypothetical protein K438DRAFT_2064437 [Mycena galopus ATCC 62051]|nr:hypothetical protein K438DRAFT_2064437 [Mycena galopus ATCC 62051]
MDQNTPLERTKRAYKRTPAPLPLPVIPALSASASYSPITPSPSSTSSQVPLRVSKRTKFQKMNDVLEAYSFRNLGEFLAVLFHPRTRGETDKRTKRHRQAVAAFLQGRTSFTMAHIIDLIYNHHKSRPKKKDPDYLAAFSPVKPPSEIRCARPCLSSWATRLVGDHAYFRVGKLARKGRKTGRIRRHLRATTNGRTDRTDVVEWEDMEFTLDSLGAQYQEEDPFLWYLTECFSASRNKGKVVVKKTRPHPIIQVGAISSFIVCRNQYASGDLALGLGLWLFACQAHVDIKRVFCRFGFSVSDSTARLALNSMTDSDAEKMQTKVRDATEQGEAEVGKVLDNIQRYDRVYEHGLGRESQLKPGAFHADDHVARVIAQERQTMTTESVYASIDWTHNHNVADLHFLRVLADFIPHLNDLSTQISARFRTTLAKHRLPVTTAMLQPLGTNCEREVENKGMQNAIFDFDKQTGIEPDNHTNILSWVRGDGASHATLMRLKKTLVTTPNIYHSFRNVISTPETWHTKATDLNSCASNHYGPASSKDPSSLSRSSNAANMKRPTDLKKCDFYPTSRSMTMIWEARVLDCWRLSNASTRLVLGCKDDLLTHFDDLAVKKKLPTFDVLLAQASIIRERYASQTAYDQSLDKAEQDEASARTKFPPGSSWTPPCAPETPAATAPDSDAEMPDLAEILDDEVDENQDDNEPTAKVPRTEPNEVPSKSTADKDGPKIHEELPGFDGDRVLSNSILFLMEFGWWIELNYAIPEGDVGRVLEILKVFWWSLGCTNSLILLQIFIFTFAGTSNQNYMGYMLDLHALLEFECSPDLKDALLNNWLFNLRGEFGKFVEGDLMQEWNNRWLEDMGTRRGGEFDEKFYRKTVAPNVLHFLKMKEDIETAFNLKRRGKSHTSPHLRDEIQTLLRLYKEEELHQFRSGRSLGHAAVNRFDRGYRRLDAGKMDDFLQRSGEYAEMLKDMENLRNGNSQANNLNRDVVVSSPDSDTESDSEISWPDSAHPSPHSSRPSSRHSAGSSISTASRAAADSVEEWDDVDHSDEILVSGSDLAVTVDPETGRLRDDWYEPEDFEALLERLCGPEEEVDEESEDEELDSDEPESESEGDEPGSESVGGRSENESEIE